MKMFKSYFLVFFLFTCNACDYSETKSCSHDVAYCDMLKIHDCEKLFQNEVFRENFKYNLTGTEPKNIVDAIFILDSLSSEVFNHGITQCEAVTFHMNFGMHIRNTWIHNNEVLRTELNEKFNITNLDNASGFIINIYKLYLREGKVDFLKYVNEDTSKDLAIDSLPDNYAELENDLNILKGY